MFLFQAHMQARYVILRVLLEAGDDLVTIETLNNPEDGEQDLVIRLDRSKVKTVGRLAIGEFLKKLQVSTCIGRREAIERSLVTASNKDSSLYSVCV